MIYLRSYWIIGLFILLTGFFLQSRLDASIPEEHVEAPVIPTRYTLDGMASWYSKKSPGIRKRTANNEIFNDKDMTCAMWGVAFNQWVRVTNKANGKFVDVRVNDRGPHRRFVQQGRIVDLTEAAFTKIASPKHGLIDIELELL